MEETFEEILKDADGLYTENKFFDAVFSYKSALEKVQGKKIERATLEHIKKRLKECIEKSDREFKTLGVEQKIGEELITQIYELNEKIILDIGNNLIELPRIAFSPNFITPFQVYENSEKTIPLTYQIANVTVFSESYIAGNNDDYTPKVLWGFNVYGITQQLNLQFHVNPILKKLVSKEVFTSQNFIGLLNSKNLTKTNDAFSILQQGVVRYLERDYVSSLHILVPQLENLLLFMCELADVETTVVERGKTITKKMTLSDRELQGEKMIELFGKDYTFFLRYVLYSPLGLSLRHKVAHGTIKSIECNVGNCNLVLLAIFIALRKIHKID